MFKLIMEHIIGLFMDINWARDDELIKMCRVCGIRSTWEWGNCSPLQDSKAGDLSCNMVQIEFED
jgi:hypothetical protein